MVVGFCAGQNFKHEAGRIKRNKRKETFGLVALAKNDMLYMNEGRRVSIFCRLDLDVF